MITFIVVRFNHYLAENFIYFTNFVEPMPIPVTERSKAKVCGRSLAATWVRVQPEAWMSVVSVVS